MLKYHQSIFDFLEQMPSYSDAVATLIDQREQELGFTLPAAVREWYSIDGSHKLLARDGTGQYPIPVEQLGTTPYDNPSWLAIMYENQGVAVWKVVIGDSDDPPVHMVYVDDYPDNPDGELYADHFSTFIHIYLRCYALIQLLHHPYTMQSVEDCI